MKQKMVMLELSRVSIHYLQNLWWNCSPYMMMRLSSVQQPKVRSWVSSDKTVLLGSLLDELAFLGAIRQISSLEPIRAGSGWKVLTLDGVGLGAPFRWRSGDQGAGESDEAGAMVLAAQKFFHEKNSCDCGK